MATAAARRAPLARASRLEQALPFVVLALAAAALIAVVSPVGDFPVDDDWLYARAVQQLVEQGRLQVPPWTAASLMLQVLWGGLFAELLGFSHTTLRASTLVLAVAGVFAFYLLGRELRGSRPALFGALLLLFNPMYVMLSYSFMTNVPFLALALWALYCDVRALRGEAGPTRAGPGQGGAGLARPEPRDSWLLAGSALAGAAFLVRQLGLVAPSAVLAWIVANHGWRASLRPRRLAAVWAPFLLAVLLSAYVQHQRGPVVEDPVGWTLEAWSEQGIAMLGVVLVRTAESFATLGLYTLPLSLIGLAAGEALPAAGWRRWLAGALLLALAAGFALRDAVLGRSPWFPFVGNTVGRVGFLPSRVFGGGLPHSTVVPDWVVVVVTGASLLGGALLVLALTRALARSTLRRPLVVPLLFGLLALGLTLPYHEFYDNYLLSVLPSALLLVMPTRWPRLSPALALAGVLLVAGWSIWWERDYLERRTAFWQAGQLLVARGIAPEQIDAGRDWVSWYRGQAAIERDVREVLAGRKRSLERGIHRSMEIANPRWVVVYGTSPIAASGTVLAEVPYGHDERAVAIQRY